MADVDNGYTRIANELLDALIEADLTKRQCKVMLAVIRKTYGFNKSLDRISDSQLVELTKLPRQMVNKAKNELITMGLLVRVGQAIGPNKTLSEWKSNCQQNSDIVSKTLTKSVSKTMTVVSAKQGHTKDTIQKTRKTKDLNTSAEPAFADSTPVVDDPVLVEPAQLPSQPVQPVPVAISMPLNTGGMHDVTEPFADQMRTLYPAVDVGQELRTMCGWLIANPTKRKTKSGITRFINAWLAKCQDRGGQNGMPSYRPRGSDHTDLTQSMTAEELNRRMREGF